MQRNRAAFSVFFWSSVPNRLSDKNKHGETPMRPVSYTHLTLPTTPYV